MKCHSYQICVPDVNLSCPTHILFEPSHTAPFDACPTGTPPWAGKQLRLHPTHLAEVVRGLPGLPLSEPHFPNFPSKSCTNLLHLPVLMLMPRHHLRALQKWQNTMTSAQSPCEAGLGRVAINRRQNVCRSTLQHMAHMQRKTISPGVQMIVQDSELINTSLPIIESCKHTHQHLSIQQLQQHQLQNLH